MDASIRHPLLGDYLRHLRTREPQDGHKRLSRHELATWAGVSYGYITRLEQGGADNPSPEVLDRIADALQVHPLERQHLHDLVTYVRPADEPFANYEERHEVTPVMRLAVDRLVPHLCGYVDDAWNVIYANAEYARIYRHITDVGNVLEWFFAVPEAQAIMLEWEPEARLTVAWLRALMVQNASNPMFHKLLTDLGRHADFRRMWNLQEIVMGRATPYMRVRDLDCGEDLNLLAQVYQWPDPTQDLQLYLGIRT